MNELNALLIDTKSIQDYIFSSNKLKHNVGASYIVSRIYYVELKEALEETFKISIDMDSWQNNSSQILIKDKSVPYEIGYIGGGNALILVKNKQKIKEIVKNFTILILKRYPGLKTAFGINYEFDLSNFKESMRKIHANLKSNKVNYFPIVVIPKFGFTAECGESGESEEPFKNDDDKFISGIIKAKLAMEPKALEKLNEEFAQVLENKYCFTNDIDILGDSDGNNFVAVIHIDGNRIGERFKDCGTLEAYRRLSKSIKEGTLNAFNKMLKIGCIEKIETQNNLENEGYLLYHQTDKKNKKIILPLRPIVIGGDDITLVCNGKLALFLTEFFIKSFIEQNIIDGKPLSACAGICIVKTKYPFYRAYHLAEDLLKRAKKASRNEDNSSYIDFFISSGGFSGDFEDILDNYFGAMEGIAHFGPYRIDQNQNEKSFYNLKKNIKMFYQWPRNKLLELRELLYGSRDDAKKFIEELKIQGWNLYELKGMNYHNEIWENKKTPYFDAIEILDFYPRKLLEDI